MTPAEAQTINDFLQAILEEAGHCERIPPIIDKLARFVRASCVVRIAGDVLGAGYDEKTEQPADPYAALATDELVRRAT